MAEILALRHELAQLLGFENYADKSLATKMAENPQQVLDFLTDLAKRARPQGEKELASCAPSRKPSSAWTSCSRGISRTTAKNRSSTSTASATSSCAVLPENKAVNGLFEVVKRIYGITAKERTDIDVWHPEVRFFELYDEKNELRGSFYLDLYARENKRGGAWMDDCVGQMRKADGSLQKPVAYLTCNFNRPVSGKPALFTHDEVIPLFPRVRSRSAPYADPHRNRRRGRYQRRAVGCGRAAEPVYGKLVLGADALAFISGHYETGEPLPKELLDKMLAAKTTRRRCSFCASWSSACSISACTPSLARSRRENP